MQDHNSSALEFELDVLNALKNSDTSLTLRDLEDILSRQNADSSRFKSIPPNSSVGY